MNGVPPLVLLMIVDEKVKVGMRTVFCGPQAHTKQNGRVVSGSSSEGIKLLPARGEIDGKV